MTVNVNINWSVTFNKWVMLFLAGLAGIGVVMRIYGVPGAFDTYVTIVGFVASVFAVITGAVHYLGTKVFR